MAPQGVAAAVGQSPVLHRYRDRMPGWLVAAAQIVQLQYAGDASRIWGDEPTARGLQQRLLRFPGIGQKKAAMAVEILDRDLGVTVRELSGSDVAYDVHVRRVFLRTGLAQYDDLDHMLDVARRAHTERSGAIDYPAWLVGRQWCHAGIPECAACVLRQVCPKDVSRAHAVCGAISRTGLRRRASADARTPTIARCVGSRRRREDAYPGESALGPRLRMSSSPISGLQTMPARHGGCAVGAWTPPLPAARCSTASWAGPPPTPSPSRPAGVATISRRGSAWRTVMVNIRGSPRVQLGLSWHVMCYE